MIKLTMIIDDDFDKDDLIRALNANQSYSDIQDIHLLFRDPRRHGTFNDKELTEKECELLERVYEQIVKITKDLPCKY